DLCDLAIRSARARASLDHETGLTARIVDPTQAELLGQGDRRPEREDQRDQKEEKDGGGAPDLGAGESAETLFCWKHSDPPVLRKRTRSQRDCLPSVARLSGRSPDPWHCVPASRRVCLCREGVFLCPRANAPDVPSSSGRGHRNHKDNEISLLSFDVHA